MTHTTIRSAIDEVADEQPDRPLLVDPDSERRLCYGDVAALALQLVSITGAAEEPNEGRIGLATRDQFELASLYLAAVYAGVPFVPLNVEAGSAHLAGVVEGANLFSILAADDMLAEVAEWAGPTPVVSTSATMSPADSTTTALAAIDADSTAVVMYTSGSTGVPKGVRQSQRNVAAMGENNRIGYEWSAADVILCPLPFWHLNACDKALGVAMSGATMVAPRRFRVGAFWRWVIDHRPTALILVPTVASELLQQADAAEDQEELRDARANIRYAGSSSAPLNAAVHDDFVERFGIPMVEAFGMSETGSIFVTPPPPGAATAGSVGRPVGWDIRILDDDGRPAPTGTAGALELRGPALTVGYDDGEAFAEAVSADGWFATGDIGRLDEAGCFTVVGRAKDIVIKGGVNIAPREVDEVVAAHPDVVEVATVGVDDALMGQDIETFVVARPGIDEHVLIDELARRCMAQLGVLKTPRRLRVIDELPKGPGGKVQPRLLLELVEDVEVGSIRAEGVADNDTGPATEFERLVHTMWLSLLDCDRLGIHQNFFDVGGYSLLALECCVSLRSRLRMQVSLGLIFENPTVSSFAEVLVAQAWTVSDSAAVGPPPITRVGDLADHIRTLDPTERARLEAALLEADRFDSQLAARAMSILLNDCPPEAPELTFPLFCAYGPFQYQLIAQRLAPATPVYGLYFENEADGQGDDLPSVPDLAAEYVSAMQEVQPEGPYHLMGYSFGGQVALEMAAQLQRTGHEVALLAPVDTFLDGEKPLWHPLMVIRTIRALIGRALKPARVLGRDEQAPTTEFVDRIRDEQLLHRQAAMADHVLPRFDGPVHLMKANRKIGGRLPRSQGPDLGWNLVTDQVVKNHFEGSHPEMVMEPIASGIADVVRPLMRRRVPSV